MAIRIPHEYTIDINQGVTRVRINIPFMHGDSQTHRFVFTINDGNDAAVLTGYVATLYAVRLADKITVPNEGTIDGNVVTIDNVQSDFLTRGRVDLLLMLSAVGEQVTLFWGEAMCSGGITETIADPSETIPTLGELFAQIAACESATTDAVTATGAANTAASSVGAAIAPAYSASSTYAIGDICTYLGTRYKCTTAITVAEAWTVGHWTAEPVQDALDAHTSQLDEITNYPFVGKAISPASIRSFRVENAPAGLSLFVGKFSRRQYDNSNDDANSFRSIVVVDLVGGIVFGVSISNAAGNAYPTTPEALTLSPVYPYSTTDSAMRCYVTIDWTSAPADAAAGTLAYQTYENQFLPELVRVNPTGTPLADVGEYIPDGSKNVEGGVQFVASQLVESAWARAVTSMLMIGDSLTSGGYYVSPWTGESIAQNIPYYIGKMLNISVENAGFSGYAPFLWYSDKFANYTYANYDAVVVWLGTNYGLTDTLATDVTPYEDPDDYAGTQTGQYCRIISKILDVNPDCIIYLCSVYASAGDVATTNSVIAQIAAKYGCTVIDLDDGIIGQLAVYHPSNSLHLGKAGNIAVADKVVRAIAHDLYVNKSKCEAGVTARVY